MVACNNLAQRLEENTIKLTTARYKARDMNRKLSSCSDQLETTKQSLQVTEKKLNDANKVLSETGCTMDRSGRLVERTSDEESRCDRRLTETEASLKTERSALKCYSSRLLQERVDKLMAAATAEMCSKTMQLKWTQQRRYEYMSVFIQGSVEKKEPPRLNKLGCNCDGRSTESKDLVGSFHKAEGASDETTYVVYTAATADSVNKQCDTRELAEARADIKAQEIALKNCPSHLSQERRDRIASAASAEECSGELGKSQYRLELLKTSILTPVSYTHLTLPTNREV